MDCVGLLHWSPMNLIMYTGKTTAVINATKSIMHIILHYVCRKLGTYPSGFIWTSHKIFKTFKQRRGKNPRKFSKQLRMHLLIWIKLFRVFKINVSRLLTKHVLKMWDLLSLKSKAQPLIGSISMIFSFFVRFSMVEY